VILVTGAGAPLPEVAASKKFAGSSRHQSVHRVMHRPSRASL